MKKKGGKKSGKKKENQKRNGRGGGGSQNEKPGFVLPEVEKGTGYGFGCMVTKLWEDAYFKNHVPLMVEIARTNMQRYWNKVTDAQSKASLMLMLGRSLMSTLELEEMKEATKYVMEAMELIKSIEKRSTKDIVYGVWPERCSFGWGTFIMQLDASERNAEMERMVETINLTRMTINSELERAVDAPGDVNVLLYFSQKHYWSELEAMEYLFTCFDLISVEDNERWLTVFGKRIEEIEIVLKREGWELIRVRETKGKHLYRKCRLYERQGKVELALDILGKALEGGPDHNLIDLHTELSLKTGRIEEAFKSMENVFSFWRSKGSKTAVLNLFGHYLDLVPDESLSLCRQLIPRYPHVLWAANAAGFAELSKEGKNALRSQLEAKKTLLCVNCNKELTKIYRCSRCELATYCGSTCQKEAWKEHKKICKKRE
jgi:tetratricopeptide (TPR) repeat protein